MELIQYLLCVANRHEVAKDEHAEQSTELWQKMKKSKTGQTSYSLTYQDEHELLMEVIASVGRKPACLKKVTLQALGALAYVVAAKIANDPCIEGHEIIDKLVYDPEKTALYLQAITELKDKGWVQLMEAPGMAFTDQPPFCWLQSRVELGDTFHREMGAAKPSNRSFCSNDSKTGTKTGTENRDRKPGQIYYFPMSIRDDLLASNKSVPVCDDLRRHHTRHIAPCFVSITTRLLNPCYQRSAPRRGLTAPRSSGGGRC